MPPHDDPNQELINEMEAQLSSSAVELTAVLSEWVAQSVHRVFAVSAVLRCWRDQMVENGWAHSTVEDSLSMILDRIWPVANAQRASIDSIFTFDEVTDDDDED